MAFFHVFELSIKEFRESDFGRKSKTLFAHGRCIARQGRRQVEASAREWTRVHDRSGAADLPRDCPRSASVRLCSKNLIYPIAVAAGNGHVGETCGSVFASAVTEESGIFENIADGFGQCFGIVGGT